MAWVQGLTRFLMTRPGGYQIHATDGATATRLGAHDLGVHGADVGRGWRLGMGMVMTWVHGLDLIMYWIHGLGVIMA